jgi:lysophospholipase L1-like esterase
MKDASEDGECGGRASTCDTVPPPKCTIQERDKAPSNKFDLPAPRKVLVFGDSTVARIGGGARAWEVHVECRPGATSEQLSGDEVFGLAFLLAEDTYGAVVLSAGANDPWPPDMTRAFLERLCRVVPDHQDVILVAARGQADRICDVARDRIRPPRLITVDDMEDLMFEEDGVHLNALGACALSLRIADALGVP